MVCLDLDSQCQCYIFHVNNFQQFINNGRETGMDLIVVVFVNFDQFPYVRNRTASDKRNIKKLRGIQVFCIRNWL